MLAVLSSSGPDVISVQKSCDCGMRTLAEVTSDSKNTRR
jgi:hypothetical protein